MRLPRLLYTTQPSVSKAIKALENDMGIVLFDRMPRGIVLTAQGREAYRYACRIVNDSRKLEEMSHQNMVKYLRISLNPSSWFTNQFVEFYKKNYEKNYHFEVYTAGVRTVMERVRDYLSDIGFVYVMEQQKKEFQYELTKNRLVFQVMQESTATFLSWKTKSTVPGSGRNGSFQRERFYRNYGTDEIHAFYPELS